MDQHAVHVIASIDVKQDAWDTFLKIFKNNRPKVLAEAGCLQYDGTLDHPMNLPPQDLKEHRLTVIESWESEDHLRAHFDAPHMVTYRERVKDMVLKVTLRVLKPL